MNREWKKLEVDNLPHDILTGSYEFEYMHRGEWREFGICKRTEILDALESYNIRYREIYEDNMIDHEYIMTHWWKDDGGVWKKVTKYDSRNKLYYLESGWCAASWFESVVDEDIECDNISSAEIPPA